MAIDPAAIAQFLAFEPVLPPAVKGEDPVWLREIIRECTGVDYNPRTEPRPPQLEGLAHALMRRQALLFYGMQLGKTKIGFDFASQLRKGGLWRGKGLVIAHAPVGVSVWETQAGVHSTLKVRGVRSGGSARNDLLARLEDDTDLIPIAWSTLQQLFTEKRKSRKGAMKLYPDRPALRDAAACFDLTIIDEIHMAARYDSLWFAMAEELVSNSEFRLGLTGTPIGRDPFALWGQTYLMDGGMLLGRNYHFFQAAFGKEVKVYGYGGGKLKEFKFDKSKLDILQHRMKTLALTYERGEVASDVIYAGTIELQMSGQQAGAYSELVEQIIESRESEEQLRGSFVKLRQISSGFMPYLDDEGVERVVHFPGSAKLAWLDDFLDAVDKDLQFIIFYEFVPTGEAISAALTKHKVTHGRMWGGNTAHHSKAVTRFQAGQDRVLLANNNSGSMSITLTAADYLLFYESPISSTTRAQAEARPMAGRTKALVIDDLVCSPNDRRVLTLVKEGKATLRDVVFRREDLRLKKRW